MGLPKEEPVQYDEWEGTAVCKGYHDSQYGRSYIMIIEGEDTFVNLGKKLAGVKLEVNNEYVLKIARKKGTKGWYAQKADVIGNTPVPENTPNSVKTETVVNTKVDNRVSSAKANVDTMSKEDWKIRNQETKWLECLRATCELCQSDRETTPGMVLDIAQKFYDYNPDILTTKPIVETKVNEEVKTDDAFDVF